jgi:hypothetical protein
MHTNEEALVDLSPSIDLLEADLNRDHLSWESALGDLIDNSFDANGSRVVIEIATKERRVTVRDNGEGCPVPDKMLQRGYSTKKNKPNMLGRYGVGLKDASQWLCGHEGTTTILTAHDGTTRSIFVCWGDQLKQRSYFIQRAQVVLPDVAQQQLVDGRGTTITFKNIRRRWLNAKDWDILKNNLGRVFAPALRNGSQIQFIIDGKSVSIAPAKDPAWAESVQVELAIGPRKARLRAGILLPQDASGWYGASYSYGHRFIIRNEGHGLGEYSSSGFAMLVDLFGPWALGTNKGSVTDAHWDDLAELAYPHIKPLLEKVRSQTLMLRIDGLRLAISQRLAGALGERNKPSGWHRQKGGPARGPRDRNDPKRGSGSGLTVYFYADAADKRIGKIESSGRRIGLNESVPGIKALQDKQDDQQLTFIAFTLLANSKASQPLFPEQRREDFAEQMAAYFTNERKVSRVLAAEESA